MRIAGGELRFGTLAMYMRLPYRDLISIINHSVIITCVLITLLTATSALNVRVYMRLAGGSSV